MKKKIVIVTSLVVVSVLIASAIIFIPKLINKEHTVNVYETSTTETLNHTELIIKNEKHSFTVMKSDFENKYSDEFLMEIVGKLGMSFGCEDFKHWNEDAETVVNGLINGCVPSYEFPFKRIYTENEQVIEKGNAELNTYFPDKSYTSSNFIEPEILNAYFEDMFGPGVRKFKAEDFMTFDEAIAKNGEPYSKEHPEGYIELRCLPETGLLAFYSCDTGFSSYSAYIYDIKELNGDYVVYTLGYDEIYCEEFTFDSHQTAAYDQLSWGGSEYVENYVYTFGETDGGNLYLKSIDENYLFAEKYEPNYYVTKPAKVMQETIYLFPLVEAGELKKEERIFVPYFIKYDKKDYALVITEDFKGYVDPECIAEIK